MPKYITDEQMRDIYAPKINKFTDERLTAENAKRIYDYLKPYQYDTDGWRLYEAAKGILRTDVYSQFPAEDNMGYFETLNGYNLLKWLEIAKFADKQYEQLPGGYEVLTSHTLDEESLKYKEYQDKLYVAAVRSIAIDLIVKQPNHLNCFWHRLSYMVNIVDKGFPTRDALDEKINRELKTVFDAASTDDLTSLYSEVEIKSKIRNEFLLTHMSDAVVQALYITDDVLDDAYRFCIKSNYSDHVLLAVTEYLENAEHDYLAERVYNRVVLEYNNYLDDIKEMPPDVIIKEAYEIVALADIKISLDPEMSVFDTDQLRALYSLFNPLRSIYDEWLDRDDSRMDDITDTISDLANKLIPENDKNEYEDDYSPYIEDEDEHEI
jgi:hypothetical protein